MSKNKNRLYVGDLIITNENFKPTNLKGESIGIGNNKYKGFIVMRRGDYSGIRFSPGHEFTNHLDGLLSQPVGRLLHKDEFNKLN